VTIAASSCQQSAFSTQANHCNPVGREAARQIQAAARALVSGEAPSRARAVRSFWAVCARLPVRGLRVWFQECCWFRHGCRRKVCSTATLVHCCVGCDCACALPGHDQLPLPAAAAPAAAAARCPLPAAAVPTAAAAAAAPAAALRGIRLQCVATIGCVMGCVVAALPAPAATT
jgi:hypothetical protein